jgi:hypothetical protein
MMPMPLIDKPGIYFDFSEKDYHADPVAIPSLSSTIARIFYDETPKHAKYAHPRLRPPSAGEVVKPDRPMDIGSAVHKRILGKGRAIDLLPFDDYKKRDAQTLRADSYAAGNIPILQSDMTKVDALLAGVEESLDELGRGDIFSRCNTEVMLVWQEKNGVWCRALLDALPYDADQIAHLTLPELKSTEGSADVDTWTGRYFGQGYDVQAAFYRRGLFALLPMLSTVTFEWVVMEQNAPHAVNILEASNQTSIEADQIVEYAIAGWGQCMASGKWPSYAGGDLVETTQWRTMRREMKNMALLQRMADWQRPVTEEGDSHERA